MMDEKPVWQFFSTAAPDYETHIVPAFTPFAQAVIETSNPQGDEIAIDIGTGTGILARLLAPYVRFVVGIDVVYSLIEQRATHGNHPPTFVTGDAHTLPFRPTTFDLAVSSFGLNGTDPYRSIPAIRQILKPGGRLAFHEWAAAHPLDELITQIIGSYSVPESEASADLKAVREAMNIMSRWDAAFESKSAIEKIFEQAGFSDVEIFVDAPAQVSFSAKSFLSYKLAWPDRFVELNAMAATQRAACLSELELRVSGFANGSGNFIYDPQLWRVVAWR